MDHDEVNVRRTRMSLKDVAGDLLIDNGTVDSSEGLTVNGEITCRGDCNLNGNVKAKSIESRDGDLIIEGNLFVDNKLEVQKTLHVRGDLEADEAELHKAAYIGGVFKANHSEVGGTLDVKGNLIFHSLEVGGSIKAGSDINVEHLDVGGSIEVLGKTEGNRIDVGGRFNGRGEVKLNDVDVGGELEIEKEVDIETIDVGGTAVIGGGKIGRKIDVGGTFRSTAPLRFSYIDVGGTINLTGGSGEDIEVGGALSSEGSLTFNNIRAGGAVNINGDVRGKNINVGGTFFAGGNVTLAEKLKVGGKAECSGSLTAESIKIGGTLKADKVEALRDIVVNKLTTIKGAKAERIEIGNHGRVSGPIIGQEILIHENAEVEDIWGDIVTLRHGARARNIYAGILRAERGSNVTGLIQFTGELQVDRGCNFKAQPNKTNKLPEPPL